MTDTFSCPVSSLNTQQFDAVVSTRLNYIYVYVFKSAHTTIKRKLWQIENLYGYQLQTPQQYFGVHYPKRRGGPFEQPWPVYQPQNRHQLLSSLLENYLKFSVVRNPYSRLLSAYLDKLKRRVAFDEEKKEELRQHFKLKTYPDSFAEFVEQVCAEPDHQLNPHWQTQTHILAFDFIAYDKIGHVENLADFYAFLEKHFPKISDISLDSSEEIAHETSATTQLSDFYTPQLQAKVYQRYKQDFLNFGYSENLEIAAPVHAGRVSGSQQMLLKPLIVEVTQGQIIE